MDNAAYDELKRLVSSTTPGPWEVKSCAGGMFDVRSKDSRYVCTTMGIYDGERSAKCIAAMRNAMPELIDAYERIAELERQRDWLAEKLAQMCEHSSSNCGVPTPCPFTRFLICRCSDVEKSEWLQVAREYEK